jgi:hypothetical protein
MSGEKAGRAALRRGIRSRARSFAAIIKRMRPLAWTAALTGSDAARIASSPRRFQLLGFGAASLMVIGLHAL